MLPVSNIFSFSLFRLTRIQVTKFSQILLDRVALWYLCNFDYMKK